MLKVLGLLLCAVPLAAGAQSSLPSGSLTRYSGNPLLRNGPESFDYWKTGPRAVLKEGPTTYRMWYEAVGQDNITRIGYATSADGLAWTKQGTVMSPDLASWEMEELSPNSILYEGGVYKLWYHGGGYIRSGVRLGNGRIGTATSADGITWTRYSGNPVLDIGPAGAIDDAQVAEPRVLKVGSGYRMYYTSQDGSTTRLCMAAGTDGIAWTKYSGNPILNASEWGGFWGGAFFQESGVWHLWHAKTPSGLHYKSSLDGIIWTNGPSNPVLTTNSDPNAPDYGLVGDSVSGYKDGDTYRLMYTGYNSNLFGTLGRFEGICMASIDGPSAPPADTDGDGMTDAFETANGFDPANGDQDGDLVPDGQDDWDADGTPNQLDSSPGSPPGAGGAGGGGRGGCGATGLEVLAILALLRSRRCLFLALLGVLLAAGGAPPSGSVPPGGLCCPAVAPAAAPQWARFPAIDSHVHLGDVWSYPGPVPNWTDILSSMDTRNVQLAVDFKALGGVDTNGTPVGVWGSRVTERLALYPAASASRFKLLCNIPYDDENGNFLGNTMPNYATWVRDGLADSISRGAAGLKMRFNGMGVRSWTVDSTGDTLPFDGPWFDGVWQKLQELRVPVVCHLGPAYLNGYYTPSSDPDNFGDELWPELLMHQRERVLRRFPRVMHVGAHQGAVIGDLWYQDELLRKNPNYCVEIVAHVGSDIFAVLDADEKAFLERFEDQILFATDFMENTMAWLTSYSQKLDMHIEPPETWPVSSALLEKYYNGNAKKLFGLNATNAAPVAHPGFVQTKKVGKTATLSGAGSLDFEGAALSYSWAQRAGPVTPLVGAATVSPTFTPLQEGTYEFELVVSDGTFSSAPRRVAVDVVPDGEIFQESGGLVAIEAENFFRKTARGGKGWEAATGLAGYSGSGYVQALPDTGASVARDRFRLDAPELEYKVNFQTPGSYVVFLRGSGPNAGGDSVHAGLDGEEVRFADKIGPFPTGWTWLRQTEDFDLQAQSSYVGLPAINVAEAGLHTLNVWMNEDGFRLDKIVLALHMKVRKTFAVYSPGTGQGPAESPRTPPVQPPADSDGDGMPDAFETANGFDPANGDQDGNLVPDGQDDWDGDLVMNQNDSTPGSVPGSGGAASSGGGGGGGCGATGLEACLLVWLLLAVARRSA